VLNTVQEFSLSIFFKLHVSSAKDL